MAIKGLVFNIQRCCNNDGPGIRTTVFMKGCPLRCLWCHNPESQRMVRELMFFANRCKLCGICTEVCPNGVHTLEPRRVRFEKCSLCGKCVGKCPYEALQIVGSWKTVEEVLNEIEKDAAFYRVSQGGITISGGEPTMQPDFVLSLCQELKKKEFHVALDTSGYCRWEQLKKILSFTDLVMLDIKHINSEVHRKLTGVDNNLIIDNMRRILAIGKDLIVRFPLIPGYNDEIGHIVELSSFLKSSGVKEIDLVPYHTLGVPKYAQLGMTYPLKDLKKPVEEYLNNRINFFEQQGIAVHLV